MRRRNEEKEGGTRRESRIGTKRRSRAGIKRRGKAGTKRRGGAGDDESNPTPANQRRGRQKRRRGEKGGSTRRERERRRVDATMGHSGGESNPGESTRRRRRVDATIGHSGGESNPGKGSMGRRERGGESTRRSSFTSLCPGSNHGLYKISRHLIQGNQQASVIPISLIHQSVHLIPGFGQITPSTWKSSSVLDLAGRGSMRRRVDESSRAACGFALFFTF